MNITKILKQDDERKKAVHKVKEIEKKGNHRAGQSGLVNSDGDVIGKCARISILRLEGVETEHPEDRDVMFEYGHSNEDVLVAKLNSGGLPEGWKALPEGDITTAWTTPAGVPVTGSPDCIIVNEAGTAVLGLEFKHISSFWTALSVMVQCQPKLQHVIQAAHYSWQLGIPYKLLYVQDVDFQSPMWKFLDKKFGDVRLNNVMYNDKGQAVKILPSRQVFDIKIEETGEVKYKHEGANGRSWLDTVVSVQDIERYYDGMDYSRELDRLPPRPLSVETDGSESSYNQCDAKYCEFASICKKMESNKNESIKVFVDEVKKQL